jgi:hypothetical protein
VATIIQVDKNGNEFEINGVGLQPDYVTIGVIHNKLAVKDNGIETAKLVDGAVTTDKLADQFTYLVDSDAALAAWCAATPGNDYTFVQIAQGTWSTSSGVNLTASATKKVVGMKKTVS